MRQKNAREEGRAHPAVGSGGSTKVRRVHFDNERGVKLFIDLLSAISQDLRWWWRTRGRWRIDEMFRLPTQIFRVGRYEPKGKYALLYAGVWQSMTVVWQLLYDRGGKVALNKVSWDNVCAELQLPKRSLYWWGSRKNTEGNRRGTSHPIPSDRSSTGRMHGGIRWRSCQEMCKAAKKRKTAYLTLLNIPYVRDVEQNSVGV